MFTGPKQEEATIRGEGGEAFWVGGGEAAGCGAQREAEPASVTERQMNQPIVPSVLADFKQTPMTETQ